MKAQPVSRVFGSIVAVCLLLLAGVGAVGTTLGFQHIFQDEIDSDTEERLDDVSSRLRGYAADRTAILHDIAGRQVICQGVARPETALRGAVDYLESLSIAGQRHRLSLFNREGTLLHDMEPGHPQVPRDDLGPLLGGDADTLWRVYCHEGRQGALWLGVPVRGRDAVEGALLVEIPIAAVSSTQELDDRAKRGRLVLLKDGREILAVGSARQGTPGKRPIPELGIELAYTADTSTILRGQIALLEKAGAFSLLLIVVAGGATFLFGRWLLVRPLGELERSAALIGQGQLPAEPPRRYPVAEIQSLSEAIRSMAGEVLARQEELEERVRERTAELNQTNQTLRESEERFRRLAENAPDMIYRMSLPEGIYEYVSPAATEVFGYTPEEMYRTPKLIAEVIHPDWKEYFETQWARLLEGDMPPFYEYQIVDSLGNVRWIHQRNAMVRDEDGHPVAIEGIVSDITERRRAEEALKDRERTIRQTQRIARIGGWAWNQRTGEVHCTDGVFAIFGREPSTAPVDVEAVRQWYPPDEWQHSMRIIEKSLRFHRPGTVEQKIYRPDGSLRHLISTFEGQYDTHGEPTHVVGVVQDITERKLAEREHEAYVRFLESLERIDRAIRESTDVDEAMGRVLDEVLDLYGCDRVWLLHPCDPAASTARITLERTRPEYPGPLARGGELPVTDQVRRSMREVLESEDPVVQDPSSGRPLSDAARSFSAQSQMLLAIRPRADRPWLFGMHQCSHARVWSLEEQRLFKEIGRRIADALSSLLTLRTLRESEEKYRLLFDNIDALVSVYDERGVCLLMNKTVASLLGGSAEQFIGKSFPELHPGAGHEYMKRVQGVIRTGKPRDDEDLIEFANGMRWLLSKTQPLRDAGGRVIAAQILSHDITERKRAEEERTKLEEQLRHSQKMEAVGQLAGGVAHDFNNLLQGIQGYTEMALLEVPQANPAHADLKEVLKASDRAAVLVRQLLAFSRRETLRPRYLDLNDVVAGLMKMLRRVIGEHIELSVVPGSDIGTVYADLGQIEQVLMNLCVNARDAMPDGGRIVIETGRAHFDRHYVEEHPWALEGDYVSLAVSDTGVGIPAEIRDRVFEPFFTTKEVGKGTGLGLATVYAIVKRHEGDISVYSEPGKGSTFRIYLPTQEEPDSREQSRTPGQRETPGGSETILVAEDDELVRDLTIRVLGGAGYTVIAARDGQEALDLFSQYRARINLALLDVVMPKKSGRVVYDTISETHPNLPVIFSSGYSYNVLETGSLPEEGYDLIQKPYNPKDLLHRVREALERSRRNKPS
ncbi:MAG: PAS domain S-box protein [Phycisphaerae bacterium]|nr:PAS domain S-box protein [Phycisphaerae bacterium]